MSESLRDAIAIRLMAQDECIGNEPPDDYMAHYTRYLPEWRASEHGGDCTKQAHTCMRCFSETYFAKADDLITGPLATALAEAEARGRRQGLEKAAGFARDRAQELVAAFGCSTWRARENERLSRQILALDRVEASTKDEEGVR